MKNIKEFECIHTEQSLRDSSPEFSRYLIGSVCLLFPLLLSIWFLFDHSWPFWDAADHVRVEFIYADLIRHAKPWNCHWIKEFMTVNYCYPPTIHIFNGFLKALCGSGRWVDSLSLVIFSVVLSCSTYGVARILLKDKLAALLSVVLINCYPVVASLSHLKLLDFPHLSMFCLAMFSLLYWQESPTWKRAWICGITFGVACTTKQVASFFLVGPALFFLYKQFNAKRWEQVWQLLLVGAVAVVFLLNWFLFNWHDIASYMSRNSGHLGGRTTWTAFVPNFLGYVNCLGGLMGNPLLWLFALSFCWTSRRLLASLSPVFIAAIVGFFCMSALSFQLPEHRYIAPVLLFPALLSAAQLSVWWQSGPRFLGIGAAGLACAGILQFAVQNYSPYPVLLPSWLIHQVLGRQTLRSGSLEPSYTPEPDGDAYGQKWIITECKRNSGNKSCWLNLLPSTPEISVHTLELVAHYENSNIKPTTVRLWTPIGDKIYFDEQLLSSFDFYLLKTGPQGLQFDSETSANNYAKIEKLIQTGNRYSLIGQRTIADGSIVSLYKKQEQFKQ